MRIIIDFLILIKTDCRVNGRENLGRVQYRSISVDESMSTTRVVIFTLAAILAVATPTLGCERRSTRILYIFDPINRTENGQVRTCIHVDSDNDIMICAGGCNGNFKHNLVYTVDASILSSNLEDKAKRSCSVNDTKCCRVASSQQLSMVFTYVCIDPDYYHADPSSVIANVYVHYLLGQLETIYGGTVIVMKINTVHDIAQRCSCQSCYGSGGVSEDFCNKMTQPVPTST